MKQAMCRWADWHESSPHHRQHHPTPTPQQQQQRAPLLPPCSPTLADRAAAEASSAGHPAPGSRGGGRPLAPRDVALIACIHDELLFECADEPGCVRAAGDLVRRVMEGAAALAVPLSVKLKVGPTWGSMRELAA